MKKSNWDIDHIDLRTVPAKEEKEKGKEEKKKEVGLDRGFLACYLSRGQKGKKSKRSR